MTDKERRLALHCLKANSDYHSEICEECIKYPCSHGIQDDVTETIIKELEQESKAEGARGDIPLQQSVPKMPQPSEHTEEHTETHACDLEQIIKTTIKEYIDKDCDDVIELLLSLNKDLCERIRKENGRIIQ